MELTLIERQEQIIVRLVDWIRDRGLESPAILFLQANKPLALVASQAMFFFQPILGFVGPLLGWKDAEVLAEYAAVLETPGSIDRILSLLDH
jgi:hypothetical protein